MKVQHSITQKIGWVSIKRLGETPARQEEAKPREKELDKKKIEKTLSRVTGLVINDEEARELTGEANLLRAADAIRALGPTTVVVKRGEHGALLFDQAGVFAAPAFPLREVQDPTGAGDSFAGGFMGALASGGSLSADAMRRAVIYGSVLASFCVERFSLDRFRTLTRAEIDLRFEEFRRLTRF